MYRCEVGDLSGKHGRLSIRATGSPERTLVFYDPNLPLVGPYTSKQFHSFDNLNVLCLIDSSWSFDCHPCQ